MHADKNQITGLNLQTAVADGESSRGLGDKIFPNHSPDPERNCLPLRQVSLSQVVENLHEVKLKTEVEPLIFTK